MADEKIDVKQFWMLLIAGFIGGFTTTGFSILLRCNGNATCVWWSTGALTICLIVTAAILVLAYNKILIQKPKKARRK